jgi:GntR family transcriptional regulator
MDYLNKSSGIPYYLQIKQMILQDINNNKFRNGKLASENKYSKNFGVTVTTIRRALSEIKNMGKIHAIKGVGYYVNKPKIEFDICKFISIGKELKEKGYKEKIKVIKKEVIEYDEKLFTGYEVENHDIKLINIERVRYIYDEPIVHENIYLNYKLCVSILKERCDFLIYDYLTEKIGISIVSTEEYIKPINLDKKESEILKTDVGLASFLIRKKSFDNYNNLIDLRRFVIRGDKCSFHVTM